MPDTIIGQRECDEYRCAEFAPQGPLAHGDYTRETAIAGCPRCIYVMCWRAHWEKESPPTAEEINAIQLASNHTLDGYWQGQRQFFIDEMWKMRANADANQAKMEA